MSNNFFIVNQKLDSFRYENNDTDKISTYKAVEKSLEITKAVENNDLVAPDAFITEDSGVYLRWQGKGKYFIVEVNKDGTFELKTVNPAQSGLTNRAEKTLTRSDFETLKNTLATV